MVGYSTSDLVSSTADSSPSSTRMKESGGGRDPALEHFEKVYKAVFDELISDFHTLPTNDSRLVKELQDYYSHMLKYCCLGGKMVRGMMVIEAARCAMAKEGELDDATWKKAAVLGVCAELLQAFFLVADDVMDNSSVRRSQPCWFRLPHVTAANAINDSLFLQCAMFRTLERHFSDHPQLLRLNGLIQQAYRMTVLGQHIDTNAQPFDEKTIRLDRFTPERYALQVRQKTSYYSFFLPCALGLVFAGKTDKSLEEQVLAVCLEMGEYFQAQDDFLDCFADPVHLGKEGTDIQEGKCTWLIVKALPLLTEAEKEELRQKYGRHDKECVEWVKALYKRHQLEQVYIKFQEDSNDRCLKLIDEIKDEAAREALKFLLKKIHKRIR